MPSSRTSTNEERLKALMQKLETMFPMPPEDWKEKAKPCKYQKILDERRQAVVSATIDESNTAPG